MRPIEMTGPEALAAFEKAARLVKDGMYEAALAVALLPSDRVVIERRIAEKNATSANRNDTKEEE